ncbi:MAG: hypothetical protein IPP56_15355 [Bacteroidetes bacterium]|nr:hypothetical protein [Bacteroidota bacterium]
MRLLITPQIYFDNPYHYQFETYDLLRFNNKSLEYAVDEYITNDLIESYNQVNNLHILQSGTWTFEEIELIQNFESASSMKYFIIDWYFIYSKLSSQYSKNSNAEIEFDTRIFIEEIFEFLSPDHNYNFTKDEFLCISSDYKIE